MSERQVALLRGINVGKAKRIAMADLKKLFEKLGYRDVKTLLNSGNVVFTASTPAGTSAAKIEKALVKEIGVASRVTVLSAAELHAAMKANSLLEVADNPSRLMVSVLNDPADAAKVKAIAGQDWGKERVALGPRVVYAWCPDSILESPLFNAIGKALKDGVTARNWATMQKIAALVEAPGK